jgi:3-hydroxyacyl-CoA dehydrogenase
MSSITASNTVTSNDVVLTDIVDGIAVITVDSPPVNTLSNKVRSGLEAAFDFAINSDADAVVLICAGKTFIAGAEISELGQQSDAIGLHDLLAKIENTPKPVVAAIHGTCLGGGLELALCTHARVAEASSKLGFPEVKLGLLPGAGGTQRLPRLVRVEDALDIVVSGRHVSAPQAAEMGFVERVAPVGKLLETAKELARELADASEMPLRVRDREEKIIAARENPAVVEEWCKANARLLRGPIAPKYCVRCVETALTENDFEKGLAFEKGLFLELLNHPESAAQRHYFFAERQASRIPDVPKDTPLRDISSMGVIGAGLMGGGIAMCFASAGIPVTIVEQKAEALERGLGMIRKNYDSTVKRGKMSAEKADKCFGLISGSLSYDDLAQADLVIEAVFERMDIKKQVFSSLDSVCKPGAILASNTSALDINEIAASTSRPQDVIGLHFFSPAHIMPLLEVVRTEHAAIDALATVMKLAKKIRKTAVVSGVCFGFIGNRMLFPRQIQADAMTLEGVMPWDVDKVLMDFGFPMGAFAMADMAGLDLGWVASESNSSTVREVLNEMGRHGQKTKGGYYDYDDKRKATPSPIAEKVIRDFAENSGKPAREVDTTEMLDRCVLPMINEGAKILAEGIANKASDIDVVWVCGYGWPVYRGGPMFYADQLGLDNVLARLKELEAAHGKAFTPAPLIEQLVAEGKTFADFGK